MSFTESDIVRFYQVHPFDSLKTVGRFELRGSPGVLRNIQLRLFADDDSACEARLFRSNPEDGHAEMQFINEVRRTHPILSSKEAASLTLSIKITYSPCSSCREGLKDFFTSLPLPSTSRLALRIQFANLYHQDKPHSTEKEIEMVATWLHSLEKHGISVELQPLRVTEDPEFTNPRPQRVTDENFRDRRQKDDQVSLHVKQIYKKLELIQRDQQLGRAMSSLSLEARNQQKASQLKTEGNEAYKTGDLDMAIKLYTRSIQLDPRNHVLYSNRAMAYKRSKRYQQALNDAEKSLQLNPDWAKGYYLKGTTLTQMKRFPEAEQALKQGLRYEPRNRELKSALSDVEAELITMRMASGIFGGEHKPPKPPTREEIRNERTRTAMEELHSDAKLCSLLKTGNALASLPPSVRRALANSDSPQEVRSEETLPTGTYVIHREKLRLPNGSFRNLSLNTRFEFVRESVITSGKVTKITRYYRVVMEWK